MPETRGTEAEQDEAIRTIADTKLAKLEAQRDDPTLDDLPSDSSDEDYQPIPRMPP
jgi:hypothetical protein